MPSVSEQLRRAREEQQLDLNAVAEVTKIKTDHLRALEAGSFDVFVAPVYIRGFVRTYAGLLKLDVPRVMAELEGELGRSSKFNAPPPLTSQPRGLLDLLMLQLSKLNWRVVLGLVVAVLLLVIAGLGWRAANRPKADPLKNLGPGLHQSSPDAPSGETLPLPPRKP